MKERRVSQAIWWLFLDQTLKPDYRYASFNSVLTNCTSRRAFLTRPIGITLYHSGKCFR